MKIGNVFSVGLGLGIVSGVFLGLGMGRKEAMDEIDLYKSKLSKAHNALESVVQYNQGVIDGMEIAHKCDDVNDKYGKPEVLHGRVVAMPHHVDMASILERISKEGLRDFSENVEVEELDCDDCPVSDICENAE